MSWRYHMSHITLSWSSVRREDMEVGEMSYDMMFWGIVFLVWMMTLLQAAVALSSRAKWWKDKGYKMCRRCGKWRPDDEMAFQQECWRCRGGE